MRTEQNTAWWRLYGERFARYRGQSWRSIQPELDHELDQIRANAFQPLSTPDREPVTRDRANLNRRVALQAFCGDVRDEDLEIE